MDRHDYLPLYQGLDELVWKLQVWGETEEKWKLSKFGVHTGF